MEAGWRSTDAQRAGIVTVNTLPRPGSLDAEICPAVGADEFVHDCEADAPAACVGCVAAAPETLEHVRQLGGRDAAPGVPDLDDGLAVGSARLAPRSHRMRA